MRYPSLFVSNAALMIESVFVDLTSFGIKAFIVVVAIAFVIALVASARKRGDTAASNKVELIDMGEQLRHQQHALAMQIGSKQQRKNLKKRAKQEAKADKKKNDTKPSLYLIDFKGDIRASATEQLAAMITAVLQLAVPKQDEVVIRLESAGGLVHSYGLAASQLSRLVEAGITSTVCVDKLAASGGYMMACTATHIVAAPFALIGSIGVVAQLPNFHRLLQRWEVDFEQHTAGKHKRTLTTLGKNTPEGRRKFKQDIERTYNLFQQHITKWRPQVSVNKVATGEVWYGQEALGLQLIDEISTSDSYIVAKCSSHNVFHLRCKERKTLTKRVQQMSGSVLENLIARIAQSEYEQRLTQQR